MLVTGCRCVCGGCSDKILQPVFLFAEFKFEGFSSEVCRSMVAMMDVSFSREKYARAALKNCQL